MKLRFTLTGLIILTLLSPSLVAAPSVNEKEEHEQELNVKEMILHHLADSYEWHITGNGEKVISLPLPVILHSKQSGWHIFLSSRLHQSEMSDRGFLIAADGRYAGKIVEAMPDGSYAPWTSPSPGMLLRCCSARCC